MEKFKNIAPNHLLRNIVNIQEVKDYLDSVRSENNEIKKWLNTVVKNYIIKTHSNIVPLSEEELSNIPFKNKEGLSRVILDEELKGKIEHIMGFLSEQPIRSWVNVPFDEMYRLANEYLAKKIKEEEIDLNYDNTKILYESINGYKWVEVLDGASLKREGKLMNHCVGFFVNESHLEQNNEVIYSLRDDKNQPHLTMKYSPNLNSVVELKGNSNSYIDSNNFRYLEYLQDFLSNHLKPLSFKDNIFSEKFKSEKEKEGDPHFGLYSFYKKKICILNNESLPKYVDEGFLDFPSLVDKRNSGYFVQDLINDIDKSKSNDIFIKNLKCFKELSLIEKEKLENSQKNIYINELNTNLPFIFHQSLSSIKNLFIKKIVGDENIFNLIGSNIKNLDINLKNEIRKNKNGFKYSIKNITHDNLTIKWEIPVSIPFTSNLNEYIDFTNVNIKNSLFLSKDSGTILGASFEDCNINNLYIKNLDKVYVKNSQINKFQINPNKFLLNREFVFENTNIKELSLENIFLHQKRNIRITLKNCKIDRLNLFHLKNVDFTVEGCEIENLQMYNIRGINHNIDEIVSNNVIKNGILKDICLSSVQDWKASKSDDITIKNNIVSKEISNLKYIELNKEVFENEFEEKIDNFILSKVFNDKNNLTENEKINSHLKKYFEIAFTSSLDREKSDDLYYVLPNIIVINQKKVKELYIKPEELHSLIILDICGKKSVDGSSLLYSVHPEIFKEASVSTLNYIATQWSKEKNIYIKKEDCQNLLNSNCFVNRDIFNKYINKKTNCVDFLCKDLVDNHSGYTKKIGFNYEAKDNVIDLENINSLSDFIEINRGTSEEIEIVLNYSNPNNLDERFKEDLMLSLECSNPKYTFEVLKLYIKNVMKKENKTLIDIFQQSLEYFIEDGENFYKLEDRIQDNYDTFIRFYGDYDNFQPQRRMLNG